VNNRPHRAVAAAGLEDRRDALISEELCPHLREWNGSGGAATTATAATPATAGGRCRKPRRHAVELRAGPPLGVRSEARIQLARCREHDKHVAQLAAVPLEIRRAVRLYAHDVSSHRSVGPWRPRRRIRNDRERSRRNHLDTQSIVRPAPAEVTPRLELRVYHAPLGELLRGPLAGRLDVRGSREPSAENVSEPARGFHHLGPFQALGLDLVNGSCVDPFLSANGRNHQYKERPRREQLRSLDPQSVEHLSISSRKRG